MTDFFYGLGRLFYKTFDLMELAGNVPNVIFIFILIILLGTWLRMQSRYNKEADRTGTMR